MSTWRLPIHLVGIRDSFRRAARRDVGARLPPRLVEALEALRREELPYCTAGASQVREFLAPSAGQRLLDVGCGADLIVHRLDRWPLVFHGVDLCEDLLVETRRFASRNRVSLGGLTLAHAAALPYRDGAFDLLVCIGVLEYGPLAYARQALEEMARVLRPGGRAVVDLPNASHPRIDAVREIEAARGRVIHVLDEAGVLAAARRHLEVWSVDASRVMTRLCLVKRRRRRRGARAR